MHNSMALHKTTKFRHKKNGAQLVSASRIGFCKQFSPELRFKLLQRSCGARLQRESIPDSRARDREATFAVVMGLQRTRGQRLACALIGVEKREWAVPWCTRATWNERLCRPLSTVYRKSAVGSVANAGDREGAAWCELCECWQRWAARTRWECAAVYRLVSSQFPQIECSDYRNERILAR